ALLSPAERDWLNAYHAHVAEVIGPELGPQDRAWLTAATQPV
ncbi:M24 family metallopeptidase C-terminal domain-containing protein, partial [Acinetobacter baumannii]